jgi:virginiamycin B lyase
VNGDSRPRPRWWLYVLITALVVALIFVAPWIGVWFNLQRGPTTTTDCTKASDPTRAGAVVEYCLPMPTRPPHAMILGPDGNFWFTDAYNGKLVRVTPHGAFEQFDVAVAPTGMPAPGLDWGLDGNLWYIADGKLGRISPQGATGTVALPSGIVATSLTVGPDGNLWLSESRSTGTAAIKTADIIARMTKSDQFTSYSLASAGITSAGGLTPGPDGNVWFAGTTKSNSAIGRITPAGDVKVFALDIPIRTTAPGYPACEGPDNSPCIGASNIGGLVTGGDNNLWFIDGQGRVGRMTTAGVTTYFGVHELEGLTGPPVIGKGPDGNIWYASRTPPDGSGAIWRIKPDGSITTFPLPHGGAINGITAGPDGGVWFLLVAGGGMEPASTQRIVRITS